MADEYTRGQMDISEHKKTFESVMSVSVYVSLLLGLSVLYLTLVFASGMDWFTALVLSGVLGGIAGYFMRQNLLYWISLAGLALVAVIGGLITALLG